MDTSLSCLINSISRFIHLVLCQATVSAHLQPSYRKTTELLKQLKLVLDEGAEQKTVLQHGNHDVLYKQCEELDMAVNEAREFMESWSSKMSKICSILQCEPLLMRIQKLSLEICQIFCTLLPSSSSSLARIKELQCLKQDGVVNHIEDALRDQQDGIVPHTDTIMQIIELLNLRPNQELFRESLAVEKERMNAQSTGAPEHLYEIINQIVGLVAHIRECLVRTGSFEIKSGVPIPPYFLCPLSLELMLDPVIVASGQTYDRSSIQKWLDHGLDICPKTRQLLSHKNLIPNYTVKAMAESWCEQNGVKIPNSAKSQSQDLVFQRSTVGSPQSKSSTPRSSSDLGNRSDNGLSDLSLKSSRDSEDYDSQLLDLVCTLSRSESACSSMSNVDYVQQTSFDMLRRSSQPENVAPSQVRSFLNPDATRNQLSGGSRENMLVSQNGSASGFDDLTTKDRVMKLVEDLQSQSDETQGAAAAELRLLAKHNKENRVIIGQTRAIPPLVSLLYSKVKETQEHAVTTLLNLSISEENKVMIAEAGAIEPLIHVLRSGTEGAKENSAAALFSLSNLEDYRAKIGRSGAVKALVSLLASGTLRGKKDAATALFNLSIFHENKSRIVQSGAVKYLVEMLDPDSGMVDKSVALLANLSTIGEGRMAIAKAGGIPSLVEVVESGSQRGKENAASVILQLCLNSPKFCTLVLQEGVVPPLVALSQSGTPRAKEKAQQLLSHFRNQREIGMVKGKS